MKLKCFVLDPQPPPLVPAKPNRTWMDAFPARHPYRCLPLTIANTHGWEVLSPTTLYIMWNGGDKAEDVRFAVETKYRCYPYFVDSHFSRGIVTFHTGYLFQTEPGWNLLVTGPFNHPKDGITPLTGIVESSWLPYPFTMNWQLTRPGTVCFQKDEPFCLLFPVPAAALETVEPELLSIESDQELARQYALWREKRTTFSDSVRAGDRSGWQRDYFKGQLPEAGGIVEEHKTKLNLATPRDMRKPGP
jgi:hypothetical protein